MIEQLKHPETLTQEELVGVTDFWRAYILSGGEGEDPSPFQMEALNNENLRDAFLFWQVGGSPYVDDSRVPPQTVENYKRFGVLPTDNHKTMNALAQVVDVIPSDTDHLDTGTVFVIASVMWALKLGKYAEAWVLLSSVGTVNNQLGRVAYHHIPLDTLSNCLAIMGALPESARKLTVDVLLGISTVDEAMVEFEEGLKKGGDS